MVHAAIGLMRVVWGYGECKWWFWPEAAVLFALPLVWVVVELLVEIFKSCWRIAFSIV